MGYRWIAVWITVNSCLSAACLDSMQLNGLNHLWRQSLLVRMDNDKMHQSAESVITNESIPYGMASRRSCPGLARSASRPKISQWFEHKWSISTRTRKRNGWFMESSDGITTPSGRSIKITGINELSGKRRGNSWRQSNKKMQNIQYHNQLGHSMMT